MTSAAPVSPSHTQPNTPGVSKVAYERESRAKKIKIKRNEKRMRIKGENRHANGRRKDGTQRRNLIEGKKTQQKQKNCTGLTKWGAQQHLVG